MSPDRMSETSGPRASGREEAFGSFTVFMRGYFSTQHLWSTEHFIRLAAELEAAHTGEARFSIRHRSYVLGTGGEAVAFLEAFVDELFQDAANVTKAGPVPGTAVRLGGLSDELVRLMAVYWNSTDEGTVSGHSTFTTRRACSPAARVRTVGASPTRTCRA